MGQTGALKKLGVETENTDGSAKSLDQIMSDMATTFEGQAAVAADSTAGQMRQAEIAMGELQETIGSALLPVITTLAGFLTDTLLPAVEGVFGWIADHQDVILALGIGLGTIGVIILAFAGPTFIAWAVAAGAAAAATLLAAAPFIAIGAVVAAVAYIIIHNWDTIRDTTVAVWDAIIGAVRAVWDWIKTNWPLLLAIITGPFGAAVYLVQRNWDTIKNAAQAVWDWLNTTWDSVTEFILGPIRSR